MTTKIQKIVAFFLTLSAWFGVITIQAQPTVYEPFNYPTGSFASGTAGTGTGETGNWTCGAAGTVVSGLTYSGLPVANNALSSGGGRQYISFANSLSSGTEWISFLYKASGNMGGNIDGVYFPNGGTGLFFGFGLAPNSGTQGGFGIGSMDTTGNNASGAANLASSFLGTYGTTYLVVMQIQFNTSGNNDTVTVYLNPVAGGSSPGVSATYTYSSFDVGTITGVGLNVQGGANITVDEIRVGSSYGSVVGSSAQATIPTSLILSVASGNEVSWTANNTDSYQPQSSSDGINWNNLGGVLTGSAVTSVYDLNPTAFYQVLDYTVGGPSMNQIPNGSFEILDGTYSSGAQNWSSSPNDTYDSVWVTNSYGSLQPNSGTNLLYLEGTTASTAPAAPNTYAVSDPFSVTGGLPYTVSFYAANPVKVGGGNPQYFIQFYDVNQGFISQQINSFASASNTWTSISTTITAPPNAAFMVIRFIQAIGAGASWDWVTLIDDVSVTYPAPGPTNVLAATVQSAAVFTATVQTNGVTATAATGSVAFQTNSVAQSTGIVESGIASSAPAIVPDSYTVTAIYSGDSTYIGSTNTLIVGGGVNTSPTNIVTSISGNQLTLAWPADHIGWTLQSQTNSLNTGLTTTWYDVDGSTTTNQVIITIDPANPTVFYRMKH